MVLYVCNDKVVSNNETLYQLTNLKTNEVVVVNGDKLKDSIRNKRVDVINLTLTSDNRLVLASKQKVEEKLSGKANLPSKSNRRYSTDAHPSRVEALEYVADEIIKDSLNTYLSPEKTKNSLDALAKNIIIKSIDTDKNTIILKLTMGVDTYLYLKYDKVVYCEERPRYGEGKQVYWGDANSWSHIFFDIAIQLVGIANKKVQHKFTNCELCMLSGRDQYNNKWMTIARDKSSKRGDQLSQHHIERYKGEVGQKILDYVGKQLIAAFNENPDYAKLCKLDRYLKPNSKDGYERFRDQPGDKKIPANDFLAALGEAIGVCGVVATTLAVNPLALASPSVSSGIAGLCSGGGYGSIGSYSGGSSGYGY